METYYVLVVDKLIELTRDETGDNEGKKSRNLHEYHEYQ